MEVCSVQAAHVYELHFELYHGTSSPTREQLGCLPIAQAEVWSCPHSVLASSPTWDNQTTAIPVLISRDTLSRSIGIILSQNPHNSEQCPQNTPGRCVVHVRSMASSCNVFCSPADGVAVHSCSWPQASFRCMPGLGEPGFGGVRPFSTVVKSYW